MRLKILLISLAALGAVLVAARALAVEPVNTGLFNNVAIDGYDPVAYFEDGRPAKGSKQFVHTWNGAEWRFTSAEHRDRFAADPAAYAPQYGGYCAWAVSQGSTAGIDPEAWKIVDGKLYLNYNSKIQERWEKDAEKLIAAGDENWPKLLEE